MLWWTLAPSNFVKRTFADCLLQALSPLTMNRFSIKKTGPSKKCQNEANSGDEEAEDGKVTWPTGKNLTGVKIVHCMQTNEQTLVCPQQQQRQRFKENCANIWANVSDLTIFVYNPNSYVKYLPWKSWPTKVLWAQWEVLLNGNAEEHRLRNPN